MKLSIKQAAELFHLQFLRQLSVAIDPGLYAIKGGCNLRFFFGSIRYSEDLDVDVQTVAKGTLEKKVDKLLASDALAKTLTPFGLSVAQVSKPKQTETTQRWKVQLSFVNSALPIPTKIEFSRRTRFLAELGTVSASVLQAYRLLPLRLMRYGLTDAIHQKCLALANRTAVQARDVFDLYLLLQSTNADRPTLTSEIKNKMEDALSSIQYADYCAQVVAFLELEYQKQYQDAGLWGEMCDTVYQLTE